MVYELWVAGYHPQGAGGRPGYVSLPPVGPTVADRMSALRTVLLRRLQEPGP
ncbi:hypothetical protein GCM10009716_23610 [Streptomyces sodiiphilus]|uniref:Uncharacterized protein n=1 Tax=Streptomyces sodiiphilus TaxID=226217 RepID=A0ABN2P6U7_9ACTN